MLNLMDKQFVAQLANEYERDLSCWTAVADRITDYAEQYNLAAEHEASLRDYTYAEFIALDDN